MGRKYFFTLVFSLLLFACSAPQLEIIITPSGTATITQAATLTRFPTRTSTPTGTITATRPPTNTATLTFTPGPSPTVTPVPPLEAHEFEPEDVLISYNNWNGDGPFNPSRPPVEFILYGNGHLVISQGQDELPVEKYLNRQEVCQILNTIDQIGFLGFTRDQLPNANGLPGTTISVNSWGTSELDTVILEFAISCQQANPPDNCQLIQPHPDIPLAIENMLEFLTTYGPDGMKDIEPKNLLLWLGNWSGDPLEIEWPLEQPSLANLKEKSCKAQHVPIMLEPSFYQLFTENNIWSTDSISYIENSRKYSIQFRFAWPYEETSNCKDGDSTNVYFPKLTDLPATISCTPEDGVIQLP